MREDFVDKLVMIVEIKVDFKSIKEEEDKLINVVVDLVVVVSIGGIIVFSIDIVVFRLKEAFEEDDSIILAVIVSISGFMVLSIGIEVIKKDEPDEGDSVIVIELLSINILVIRTEVAEEVDVEVAILEDEDSVILVVVESNGGRTIVVVDVDVVVDVEVGDGVIELKDVITVVVVLIVGTIVIGDDVMTVLGGS
ncbi:hypothetical protein BpHYR1_054646 [Brachionus plicatilis]|uniref:Uncharacterized protein n=1 Tax=Brachionus plicatilis TaxID=10195 RepID=A0A3M7R252_BRAPC|nr:hypothetical protein BpHYR1_054646 [Brachionus plicatilis]